VCGKSFVFTAGEREFYEKKGFLSPPKRCPDCRRERRERQRGSESQVYRSPSFTSGPAASPGSGEYRSPAFREYDAAADASRERARRPTYPAICAQCGVETQLPFRPVEGKEYYCRDCYRARKGGG
jgi:CxxC-x17-CxxC domain-containing protein